MKHTNDRPAVVDLIWGGLLDYALDVSLPRSLPVCRIGAQLPGNLTRYPMRDSSCGGFGIDILESRLGRRTSSE